MVVSNSPLVKYTKLSPNHSGLRNHKIDTITPHCVVGHLSLQTLGNVFLEPSHQASSNYGVNDAGEIGMFVEEKNRSWCSYSGKNDNRAVTIEIASDRVPPYKITSGAMQGLINLSVDICKRNGIPKLIWENNKALIGEIDKQNITIHRWFYNTICPGDYIISQLGHVASEVNKILLPKQPEITPAKLKNEYLVKVGTEKIQYRQGPGTDYIVLGTIHKNEIYTIVEESKWGKLKSGAGWIPLDNCIKM